MKQGAIEVPNARSVVLPFIVDLVIRGISLSLQSFFIQSSHRLYLITTLLRSDSPMAHSNFEPTKDIPDLKGKVFLVTGGLLSFQPTGQHVLTRMSQVLLDWVPVASRS